MTTRKASTVSMMSRNCVLCFNRNSIIPLKENHTLQIPSPLVSSCNKYLSHEIVQTVAWSGVYENGLIFCQQCFDNIEKLSRLNIQLEQLQQEINHLVSHVNQDILKERRTYELSSPIRNVNDYSFSTQTSTLSSTEYATIPKHYYDLSKENNIPTESTSNFFDSIDAENHDDHWRSEGENEENADTELKLPSPTGNATPKAITSTDLQPFLEKGSEGYQCKKCLKKFARLTILQRHDCDKQTYNCDTCGLAFSSQGVLKLHVSRTHSGVKPFKCETCGKEFGFKHHLVLHIRSHTGEKPYACDLCDKRFSDSSCFNRHKRKHESNVRYNCDICNKSYATVKALQYHVKVHLGTSNYKCESCGRAFASRKTLTNHQVTHTGEKTHFCDQCGKGFSALRSLQTHMLRHTGEKPIQCPLCDKRFRSNPHLRQHTIIVHEKPETFICDTCGKTCTNSVQYKHHLKGHKNPIRECTLCGKTFKYKHSLEMHIKTAHDGEKPIKCDLCGQSFRYYSALGRHKDRNCQDEKPKETVYNRCSICKRSYKGEDELFKHQLVSHSVTSAPSVTCEKCDSQFVDLGGYQWHLLELKGFNKFKCRKCKNQKKLYVSCCNFFSHCKSTHNGKGNHFSCKYCQFTMQTKYLNKHKCSQSESESKATKLKIRKNKPRICKRNKPKKIVDTEGDTSEESEEDVSEDIVKDTVIKEEHDEMSDGTGDDVNVNIAVKLEPESEEDS